ncbi:MAG: glycosyltransferase family 2 protein [Candidatus Omnitrophota bacterium]
MKKKKISIIIPAYNEQNSIGKTLEGLVKEYSDMAEIIIINDGSNDKTPEIIRQFKEVKLINHKHNHGYGASLKSGIHYASTDAVCFYDADDQHHNKDIERLIKEIDNADMVIGSRGISAFKNWLRAPGKLVLHFIANFLVNQKIPDLNSGFRIVKRDILLKYIHLLPDGFSASTTMTMVFLSRGYDVKFIPITVKKRIGTSQVRQLRDGVNTIKLILRLIMLFNPLRFFVSFGFISIGIGMIYGTYKVFTNNQMGFPVGALLIVLTGMLSFIFGLLADQISALRLERFEKIDYLKHLNISQDEVVL